MTCFFFSLLKRATPLMAMLLVSVAPEVKTTSLESAPIRSATCCGNDEYLAVGAYFDPFSRKKRRETCHILAPGRSTILFGAKN